MHRFDQLSIDPDIRRAETLPGWVYTDPRVLAAARERVFAKSWQFAGDTDAVSSPGSVHPFTLLEGFLDEPLLLTRDRDARLHCFSNTCTHRGNLVAGADGSHAELRCRYHGRRFALDGRFLSMPEFLGVERFPSASDDLKRVPFGTWEKLLFVSLGPDVVLDDVLDLVRARCVFLPLRNAVLDPGRSREYLVRANWALYCDNYLEGFHVPFVHPELATSLDYASYRTELFEHGSLQVGIASEGEDVFDLPRSSPDHGQPVAAYYVWLFPNTMLNVYPWGISVNVVRPLAVDSTKVSFLSYVWDRARLDRGAGAALDLVELQDEAVVEGVQRGVCSRLYGRGRYSPSREQGVHHFHRMLVRSLCGD